MTRALLSPDSVPAPVIEICRRLRDGGHGAWIVGGCVRDLLLGNRPKDWDIATSARPQRTMALFRRVIPTGLQHGTVTIRLRGEGYEVTTLRGEGAYSDGRHPDRVVFIDDLSGDLARRDFTINAVAYDPLDDRIDDPFEGVADMKRKVIRAVGDAAQRFSEDGLRVLRAARFAATLRFTLAAETRAAIFGALSTFRAVSHERVRDEWLKIMEAERPSEAFEVMRDTGILAVTCPVLLEQVGCAQNRCHAFDVWEHTMRCLDGSDRDPVLRLAALFHDLGKPRTREMSDKTGDYTFYHHETVGAKLADAWLREYRFPNETRRRAVHLVRHHLVQYSGAWTDAAVRRFVRRVGDDEVPAVLSLVRADIRAKGMPVDEELRGIDELDARIRKTIEEGAAFGVRQLAVDGNDVIERLGIRPGPLVGRVLEELLERVLEEPERNEREMLLRMAEEIGGKGE
jgi:tRNA nucleotidyltransferase (CCA-adding enzyme)